MRRTKCRLEETEYEGLKHEAETAGKDELSTRELPIQQHRVRPEEGRQNTPVQNSS